MSDSYLIVGASSDIGITVADKLLSLGNNVVLYARDTSRLSNLKDKGAKIIDGDALNEESLKDAINITLEYGNGKISGIANLVGSIKIRPPHVMSLQEFDEVIKTNLSTAFLTVSLGGKVMLRNNGGRIVLTSSVAGSLGLVNHEAIAAAKGGIESMTRAAAATYAKRNIRINAVAPGLTDTRLSEPILKSEQIREASKNMIPIKRINTREEIAKCIVWLLTDAPDNLTGQVLHLDGGMSQILA